MKKIYTFILFVIMFCIIVNVIVNDMAYTLAFIIYCVFLTSCCLALIFFAKRNCTRCIKELREKAENIIKNIT